MSDTVNDTRNLDVLKDLRTIRDTMPQIFEMILQSGACPHLLSVPCVCDPAISCRDLFFGFSTKNKTGAEPSTDSAPHILLVIFDSYQYFST